MSVDIIRTIILPVLLLTVIVAISLYFYKEGFIAFTYAKDPTCPVGSYSTKTGGICTGTNTTTDSTGDLPNSYSGAPDPTCAQGSGTSKKTGGICVGPNPNYNYGAAQAIYNLFGNAGGSVMPTNTPRTTTQSALTYNPNDVSPLFDASDNDMYNVYRFVSDSSGSSTDPSANPVITTLVNILNGVSASASVPAPASAPASAAPLPKKPSTKTTSTDDDDIVGHLAGGQGCPIEEECCEVDCEESISMKQGRTLKKNKCKPYVATNQIPCWGC